MENNSASFDKGYSACQTASAIIVARDIDNLLPEEDEALSRSIDDFEAAYTRLVDFYEESQVDEFGLAVAKLGECWEGVVKEKDLRKDGQTISRPVCIGSYDYLRGNLTPELGELAALRMMLRQAEMVYLGQGAGLTV